MQTINDYEKKIMKAMEEEDTLTQSNLKKKVNISTYQGHSNFLEALYRLQLNGSVYSPKSGVYEKFPNNYYYDYIIKTNNGLRLLYGNRNISAKEKSIIEGDKVIVTITEDKTIKILKVIKRKIENLEPYLLQELKKKDFSYKQIKNLAIAKSRKQITELKELLQRLEEEGKIYRDEHTYKIWPKELVLTKLELDEKGNPYFLYEGKRIYKEGKELNGALREDIIAVSRRGKHIKKIIKRNIHELVLEVIETDGVKELEPILLPGKGKIKVRISSTSMKKLHNGDRILANVSLVKTEDNVYEADFLNKIGEITDKDIDVISIAAKYGFYQEFSKEAMIETEKLPTEVTEEDMKGRYDLRKRFTAFTIDCDNTKDMDDAVSIMKNENGNYILAVHIAHVSHYIKRNSILDKEALERGLSAYPANSVIPNLPPKISNGICSLNPKVPRLTKTCIMEISKEGEILKYEFIDSVIESKIKMSYAKVNKLLDENIYDEEYAPYVDDLKLMKELSDILTRKRMQEGMLVFDENEVSFKEDENGNVIDIENKTNGTAGLIIENFMIEHNYCEALLLNYTIGTSINRVHETPDEISLSKAIIKLEELGYDLPKEENLTEKEYLQIVLNNYKNTKDFPIISQILLKSMPRARYSPYPTGHFGLGMDYYTHSTSPIRRYADLKAQQIIDSYNEGNLDEIEDTETLKSICDHCSFKEQQADLLEREVNLIKMMKYVDRHKDKYYHGTITDINEERAYLETATRIPGYIEYKDIPDIIFIKSKKRLKNEKGQVVLKVGDSVYIKSNKTNHRELKVDFDFIKNLTLEANNEKGATALRKDHVKKLSLY